MEYYIFRYLFSTGIWCSPVGKTRPKTVGPPFVDEVDRQTVLVTQRHLQHKDRQLMSMHCQQLTVSENSN
jgi:hypothetical protein